MMFNEEIKKLINSILKKDELVKEYIFENNFLYIIVVHKNFVENDDRYNKIGGNLEPIKIDLNTKKFERIHYLDFPKFEKELNPSIESIVNEIKSRRYLNEEDIFNFILYKYGENLTKDYSFYIFNEKEIGFEFYNEKTKNVFKTFFIHIGAVFLFDENLKILISRIIE